jgi:hypothetical protein
MTSALYTRAAATALRLLTDKGQAVTITKTGGAGTYDTATGSNTVTPPAAQTVMGAVFEYNTFIRSGVRNDKTTLVTAGDKQLLLAATATDGTTLTAPVPDDTVQVGVITYTITAVAPLSPAGAVIYYECNIRGAA